MEKFTTFQGLLCANNMCLCGLAFRTPSLLCQQHGLSHALRDLYRNYCRGSFSIYMYCLGEVAVERLLVFVDFLTIKNKIIITKFSALI